MTNEQYILELARAAGIDPSHIDLVDCSGLSNEFNVELLEQMAQPLPLDPVDASFLYPVI